MAPRPRLLTRPPGAPTHRLTRGLRARAAALAATGALAAGLLAPALLPAGRAAAADADATEVAAGTASVGSLPLGSTSYPVPADAVVVSPAGSDGAAGTLAAPVRTVNRAMAIARAGSTIVLRGGAYHERVVVTKQLTFQSYPGESAWLEGSVPVSGWTADGAVWRYDGWTVRHDASPTYTRGAAENPNAGWTFVDYANYPMAAHPDQLFVDGAAMRQVASRDRVVPGTFFLDQQTSQLYLGTDPTGREVRASDLGWAMNIRASGVVVRGIGVRRYAPSVWMLGAVVVEKPARLENLEVEDSATTGVSVVSSGVTLSRLTVRRSGMLGIHGHLADGIVVERTLSEQNNLERFNSAPVSGGLKITTSRGITVRQSVFRANLGPGLWLDESAYAATLVGNQLLDNTGHGISFEISARAVIAGNLFRDNGGHGLKVNNSSDVAVWNNTFVGGGRPLNLVQDTRRNDDPRDSAIDDRVAWPDPEMPWLVRDVVVANNVVSRPSSRANCLLCVEDYSQQHSAEQMRIRADGNVYERRATNAPSWTTVWSRGAGNPSVFTSVRAFAGATGQDARSVEVSGSIGVDLTSGRLSDDVAARTATVALPLTDAVAAATGLPAGTTALGAFDLSGVSLPPLSPTPLPVTGPGAGSVTTGVAPVSGGTGAGTGTTGADGASGSDPAGTAPTPATTGGTDRTGGRAAVVLARDGFDRRVQRGWGRAERGGRWLGSASRSLSVADGVASLAARPGRGASVALSGLSARDTETALTLDPATGARVGVTVRHRGRSGYRLSLQRARSGRTVVLLERVSRGRSTVLDRTTVRVRGTVHVRLAVAGQRRTTLRARIWGAGPEPTAWNATAVDTSGEASTAGTVALSLSSSRDRARTTFSDVAVLEAR